MENQDSLTPTQYGKMVGMFPDPPHNPLPTGGYMDAGFDWVVHQAEGDDEECPSCGSLGSMVVEEYGSVKCNDCEDTFFEAEAVPISEEEGLFVVRNNMGQTKGFIEMEDDEEEEAVEIEISDDEMEEIAEITLDAESESDDKVSLRVWAKDMEKDHLGYFVSKNKDGWETWKGLCGITTDKGVSRRFNVSNYDGSYGRRCRKCLTAYKKSGQRNAESEDIEIVDIDWETDGEDVDLPSSVRVPSDLEEDEIADYLSDNYGFLVNGFVMGAETFGAEEGVFYQLEVKYNMEDGWEWFGDYDDEQDAINAYHDIYLKHPEVKLLEVDSEGDSEIIYVQRNFNLGAETFEAECITCAEPMGAIPKWSCECCGLLVGTQGDHEGCGDNISGTVVCNYCYQEGHKVTTMITLDGNEVIFNSTCKGWDNEKHFGDREYEITDEYVLGAETATYEPSQEPDMEAPATEPTNANYDAEMVTCAECGMEIDEEDIIGDGTNRGLCCVPDYYDADFVKPSRDWLSLALGTAAVVIGGSLFLQNRSMFKADGDEMAPVGTGEPSLVAHPSTGDLLPADYEEMIVESTGYAVPIIPVSLDPAFMGSRFHALPTDRTVESNEPGIGAHTDVAMTRDTDFREPEQSMITRFNADGENCECSLLERIKSFFTGKSCCEGKEVKEANSVTGQTPYFGVGFDGKNTQTRVIKETNPISLDPSTAPYIPQNLSGYTGQAYTPPTVYSDMMNIGVSGQNPAFVSTQSSSLQSVHGNLSAGMNQSYTDGSRTMSLSQWSIDYDVSQTSDSEAFAVSRSSGVRTMIRRV